jgi:hypothetical protein
MKKEVRNGDTVSRTLTRILPHQLRIAKYIYLFAEQWAAPFLLMGVYNKMVIKRDSPRLSLQARASNRAKTVS